MWQILQRSRGCLEYHLTARYPVVISLNRWATALPGMMEARCSEGILTPGFSIGAGTCESCDHNIKACSLALRIAAVRLWIWLCFYNKNIKVQQTQGMLCLCGALQRALRVSYCTYF